MKSKLFTIVSLSLVFGMYDIAASYRDSQNPGDGNTYAFRRIQSAQNKNSMRTMSPRQVAEYLEAKEQQARMVSSRNSCSSIDTSLPASPVHGEKDVIVTPATVAVDYSPMLVANDTGFQSISAQQIADQNAIANICIKVFNENFDRSDETSRILVNSAVTAAHILNQDIRNTPTLKALKKHHQELSNRSNTPIEKLDRLQQRIDALQYSEQYK